MGAQRFNQSTPWNCRNGLEQMMIVTFVSLIQMQFLFLKSTSIQHFSVTTEIMVPGQLKDLVGTCGNS